MVDPATIHVPNVAGTYATTVVVNYSNYVESHSDTIAATITLRDAHYRGHFGGTYVMAGDSGLLDGFIRPDGTLEVTDFGSPPTPPLSYVGAFRRLYPWCDFPHLNAGWLNGTLQGDTLRASGGGLMPCFYNASGQVYSIETGLFVNLDGVR